MPEKNGSRHFAQKSRCLNRKSSLGNSNNFCDRKKNYHHFDGVWNNKDTSKSIHKRLTAFPCIVLHFYKHFRFNIFILILITTNQIKTTNFDSEEYFFFSLIFLRQCFKICAWNARNLIPESGKRKQTQLVKLVLTLLWQAIYEEYIK